MEKLNKKTIFLELAKVAIINYNNRKWKLLNSIFKRTEK